MIGKEIQLTSLNTNQREGSLTPKENKTMPPHSSLLDTNLMKQVEAADEEPKTEEKHHRETIIHEVNKLRKLAKASLTHFCARSATRRDMIVFSTVLNSQNSFQEEVM